MMREVYSLEHPDARKEYESMYAKETSEGPGKRMEGQGMCQIICVIF